jgi:hypothetical protein
VRRNFALALAAGLPLAFYLWTLSGASYWLDGGEFVAAAINLDIAHPPGHPLTALYGKAWSLLPLGPLAFRIALGQAMAAALGAACLFRACEVTARSLGLSSPALTTPIALLGAWLSALGYAVWFQAIRPEVYALQSALLFFAMQRLARLELDASRDPRPLYAGAFAVGLGLTNHHLMAFFLFPALLWSAFGAARRRAGLRPLLVCAVLGLLALCVYAYLPVRAARHPPENLGDPVTLERIYWVVSARVYARDMGSQFPQPLAQRFGDVGIVLSEQLLYVFVPAALLGLYAMLRRRESRALGVLWLLVASAVLCIRPWLGSVRGNPDAIAYLSAGLAAAAVLASAACAALVVLARDRGWSERLIGWPLWLSLALVVAFMAGYRAPRLDLSSFHATDMFDEYRQRALPPRSVLVLTTPQTVFRQLELAATEGLRRDIALVPLPFLRYPGVAQATLRSSPDLRELVSAFLASERLGQRVLERLASQRPVMIELDPHLPPSAYPTLLPAGLLYAPVGPRASQAMLVPAASLQRGAYDRIYADLGRDLHEVETSHQLLWLHYMDALYYASRGERVRAQESLMQAARLYPKDTQLAALRTALGTAGGHGRIDVRRFLSFDAVPRATD